MEFMELLVIDVRRGIDHQVAAGVIFWEGDEIAYGFLAAQKGYKPVKAKGNAAVRGGSVFEGIHQKAELLPGFFFAEAQELKHFVLKCFVENSYGASADFVAIEYQIVGISTYTSWV